MQNGDVASPGIMLAGRALLVKILINLEPHGILGLNFLYLSFLILSSQWYAQASPSIILASRALLVKKSS